MAVTIQQLLNEINPEDIQFQLVNNSLVEINRGSNKKAATLKIGVPDEVAMSFMGIGGKTDVGLFLFIERDVFDKAKKAVGM